MITYGSVCSGIEAATVAMEPAGWKASWFAEIERFPSEVLKYHYPETPNLGDMTKIAAMVRAGEVAAPDVLVGGTPCQAFSVAGLRQGLQDKRGQLTLSFVELANEIDAARSVRGHAPCIVWWENVPGVLSSKDNAFGCFLGALAGEDGELQPPGKKWPNAGCVFGPERAVAWRVLDAQYFGVPQRRRRVFVVASARNGFHPASVLFEFDGLRRDSAPSREAGQETAGTITSSLGRHGGQPDCGSTFGHLQSVECFGGGNTSGSLDVAACLTAKGQRIDFEVETFAAQPFAFDTTQNTSAANRSNPKPGDACHPLAAGAHPPAIAFDCKASGQNGFGVGEIASTMRSMNSASSNASGGVHLAVAYGCDGAVDGPVPPLMAVRRLTPRECERLQGFPDDYSLVLVRGKPAADGPRYKALGNSMAVPCMRWIGLRIAAQIAQAQELEAA